MNLPRSKKQNDLISRFMQIYVMFDFDIIDLGVGTGKVDLPAD